MKYLVATSFVTQKKLLPIKRAASNKIPKSSAQQSPRSITPFAASLARHLCIPPRFKMIKWNYREIIHFFSIYKNYVSLWNVRHEDYGDKLKKDADFEKLVNELTTEGLLEPDAEIKKIKAKIKSLKDAFRHELTKISRSRKSGVEPREFYKPKLVWFQSADFLTEVMKSRNPPSNEKLSPSNRPSTSSCLRKRKSSIQEEESRVDRLLQSQTNNTTTTTTTRPVIQKLNSTPTTLLFATPQAKAESDEYEAVGMNVAAKLRKMSATQQIFAESLIVKILTKGMLEKLTEDTDVITVTNYYEYNRSSNNCYISGSNSTDPEDVSNCEVQFHE